MAARAKIRVTVQKQKVAEVTKLTIEQAIREALHDDGMITKYEARVLRELILADNYISKEEKTHLQKAMEENSADEAAFEILSVLLFRDTCASSKYRF